MKLVIFVSFMIKKKKLNGSKWFQLTLYFHKGFCTYSDTVIPPWMNYYTSVFVVEVCFHFRQINKRQKPDITVNTTYLVV